MADRQKHIEHEGDTFLLEDVSGGDWCRIKVTFKNQVGYLGVHQKATAEEPYSWFVGKEKDPKVKPDGLTAGKRTGDFEKGLRDLCRELQEAAEVSYDKEEACNKLRAYIARLTVL